MIFKGALKAVIVALATASPAGVALAAEQEAMTLFECQVGDRQVRVTATGDRLSYRYGSADVAEVEASGSRDAGNVYHLAQRFAGMAYQLRFVSGEMSYIVYSHEGNANTGAAASAGLVVLRGTERVLEQSCARYSEFNAGFDYSTLPQDSETYSAM